MSVFVSVCLSFPRLGTSLCPSVSSVFVSLGLVYSFVCPSVPVSDWSLFGPASHFLQDASLLLLFFSSQFEKSEYIVFEIIIPNQKIDSRVNSHSFFIRTKLIRIFEFNFQKIENIRGITLRLHFLVIQITRVMTFLSVTLFRASPFSSKTSTKRLKGRFK